MLIKYSKLVNAYIAIYTLDDKYIIDSLIRHDRFNLPDHTYKVCTNHCMNAFNWTCAYADSGTCGMRYEIGIDINDLRIYNDAYGCYGCIGIRNNQGTFFGARKLSIDKLSQSLYLIKYVTKMEQLS